MIKRVDENNAIIAYKAFNSEFCCRNFQYKVGGTYFIEGEIELCRNGFHACSKLSDVFEFYPILDSHIAIVKLWGDVDFEKDNTKMCASNIHIWRELSFRDVVEQYLSENIANEKKSYQTIVDVENNNSLCVNGNYNNLFNINHRLKLFINGNYNNISPAGDFDTLISKGNYSYINGNAMNVTLISIGRYCNINSGYMSNIVSFGDNVNITTQYRGFSRVRSDGNNCSINLMCPCNSCIVSGNNAKIYSTDVNYIDSKGINNELVLNGNNISFRAKKGSTVTCVGKRKIVVGYDGINEDTWYLATRTGIKECSGTNLIFPSFLVNM